MAYSYARRGPILKLGAEENGCVVISGVWRTTCEALRVPNKVAEPSWHVVRRQRQAKIENNVEETPHGSGIVNTHRVRPARLLRL